MVVTDLSRYTRHLTEHTELRVQENRTVRIVLANGNIMENERTASGGVSARIHQNKVWGFASAPAIDDDTVKSVISAATENAAFLSAKKRCQETRLPSTQAAGHHDFSDGKQETPQKKLLEFLRILDSHIVTKHKKVSARSLALSILDMEKSLLTRDGSQSYLLVPKTSLFLSLTALRNGVPTELYDVHGGLGRFEDNFSEPQQLFARIDQQVEHLMKKAEGIYPRAGTQEVILGPDVTGILAHEAIGHTVEADMVLGGSVAGEYLNQQVADPLVSLVDYAHAAMGRRCPVPVYVDDEGSEAKDVVIIKDGWLRSYLHTKETAQHFGVSPTGNARAFAFSDEPLIRMRNTAILPGVNKLQDMISSVEDGYYLMRSGNGQADSTSEFMFGIVLGYEIKDGKLGRGLRDITISGVAFDVMKTVSMVSDDMSWRTAGMCGKKQPIPVGMGGPAVKCNVNIGGR